MSPNIGAVEEGHAQRDVVLLDEVEQALPDALLRPPEEQLRRQSHQGPSSAGMPRHLAPFWCRQKMAEIVRRNSFGGVLPRGRTSSISGSQTAHAASVKISHPFFSAITKI